MNSQQGQLTNLLSLHRSGHTLPLHHSMLNNDTILSVPFQQKIIPKSLPVNFQHTIVPIKNAKIKVDSEQTVTYKQREITSIVTRQSENELQHYITRGSRLSILSHEDLVALAVCDVDVPELEGPGTPNDPRMGSLEDGRLCYTCHQTNIDCPGHLGIIRLNRWYLQVKFAEYAIRTLMSICNSCGHCLLTETMMKRQGLFEMPFVTRLKKLSEICSKQRCTKQYLDENKVVKICLPNPTYFPTKAKDTYIVMCQYTNPECKDEKIDIEKSIDEIYDIFTRIPVTTLNLLGFTGKTKPKDFIMRSLAVPPPCARAYVVRDGEISHDYLTTCYADITRYNNIVGQKMIEIGDDIEVQKKNAVRNLYFYISHMIDNSDGRYTRSRDEPIQSVCERLTLKTGLIRGASMGKRVNFSGRSVLNPDNDLEFGQVAYPSSMKNIHTTPLSVSSFNLNIIQKMYNNKEITYITINSGALKGRRFKIMDTTRKMYLPQIGDIVERIAMDGDETLFNRQPTLHKQSIMGYKAKYIENYSCIGLHSSYTTPHNADFDGDEGNKHKMQTIDARVETRHIANVESCIMNSQSNKPIMGMVYNTITSAYLLTGGSSVEMIISDDMWIQAKSLLKNTDHLTSFSSRLNKWNIKENCGLALFSILLPEKFYYNSGDIKIRDGILIKGPITKKQIGPVSGSIIHHIHKIYGKDRTSRFFTETQWLLDWYIEKRGFSIGLKNCICTNTESEIFIKDIIDSEIDTIQLKIESLGKIRTNASLSEINYHEKQIQSFLNMITRIGNRISLEALSNDNSLNVMSRSGSKGTETNTAQIIGCLGQQYIKGLRPSKSMSLRKRCLPYFEPESSNIETVGFIKESFMTGLNPANMIFHMMASRIGLMDTALKTADTGHMHHRINKTLEDFYCSYDGSIRNMNNTIFQYSYSDGFDAGNLILTYSKVLGNVINFIDLNSVVGELNVEAGYDYV